MLLENIALNNVSKNTEIALIGASVESVNLPTITIELIESMRARAIEISGTPGGDNAASILNISAAAMKDMAGNGIVAAEINIAEIADTGRPRMKSATVQLTDGVVTLEMNETVDVTPTSLFHLSNVFISDFADESDFSLVGSTLTMIDSTIVTIHLTEIQRVQAILRSDAPGGNINPLHINTQVGAFVDLAGNNNTYINLVMTEFADTGSPMLINASINYSTGELLMFFNETIKCDPLTTVDVTQVTHL